ncbi:hypothetical protein AAFG13_34810 [Bradyrhizobium sp. B124]|uniref:hypothetical protein n=1 Tax=Bradyrhizobium sp. B124 TaxID=3140245 RepID=UPI0031839EC2
MPTQLPASIEASDRSDRTSLSCVRLFIILWALMMLLVASLRDPWFASDGIDSFQRLAAF